MHTRAYLAVAASCVEHMTILLTLYLRLEGPELLCKLPECLMAHVWPWNPEVSAFGVARHFAKALGDRNLTADKRVKGKKR